jgi:hypothetical protein
LLRPLVGALLMEAAAPADLTLPARVGLGLAGAAATLATHFAKSTTRLTSTAAVRGATQFALSICEDLIALALGALVFFVPWVGGVFVGALALLLVIQRRRVARALSVLFFRLKHPRRALMGS